MPRSSERLRLLILHIWSHGGSCHEMASDEDYWHSNESTPIEPVLEFCRSNVVVIPIVQLGRFSIESIHLNALIQHTKTLAKTIAIWYKENICLTVLYKA